MACVQIVLLGQTYLACVCEIEKCAHVWLSQKPEPPPRCSSCKSTKWNPGNSLSAAATPKTSGEVITDLAERLKDIHPPAEFEDGEPYRVSDAKPRPKPEKADTLTANLCTHGLYKPLCHRPH
jgi:hypothetical protein